VTPPSVATGSGPDAFRAGEVLRIEFAQADLTLDDGRRWQGPVALPFHWNAHYAMTGGIGVFELAVPAAVGATEAWTALLIERVGNAFTIAIDGKQVAAGGEVAARGLTDTTRGVQLIRLPPGALDPRSRIRIEIRADPARRAGLSAVAVGPIGLLEPLHRAAVRSRVTSSQWIAAFCGAVALLAAGLWVRTREPLFGLAALAEGSWALRVAEVSVQVPPLAWPGWALAMAALFGLWLAATHRFATDALGITRSSDRLLAPALGLYAPIAAVASLAADAPGFWISWVIVATALYAVLAVRAWRAVGRAASAPAILLALAVTGITLAAVIDWLAARVLPGWYGVPFVAKYFAIYSGITVLWIVVDRYTVALRESRAVSQALEHRVRDREQALAASMATVYRLEAERLLEAQRVRIVRDMHDGVGSHLATALRVLEAAPSASAVATESIRDAMLHLKLTIDAMAMAPGDVSGLLASLRYRLGPRVQAAGVAWSWDVDPLPPWDGAGRDGLRHLQFVLLELLSNALQHSGARALRTVGRVGSGAILIDFLDDGRGADPAPALGGPAGGAGLSACAARLAIAGGRIELIEVDRGFGVRIVLPLASSGAVAAQP